MPRENILTDQLFSLLDDHSDTPWDDQLRIIVPRLKDQAVRRARRHPSKKNATKD